MIEKEALFCFPGSFCPPTYGHVKIVEAVAKLFPEVLIVNSTNEEKNERWFSEEECMALWQHYTLPNNVRLTTFGALRERKYVFSEIVMIRGIRGAGDLPHENGVLMRNYERMGISKYFYMITDPETAAISSTKARHAAETLQLSELATYVAPGVVTALLEKVLDTKCVTMVVGRPGGGKSTTLRLITEIDSSIAHINTDDFNHALRPLLEKSFPGKDMVQVALHHETDMLQVISKEWLIMLSQALTKARGSRAIFVEVPCGMQIQKSMYRFLGRRVLYVGCKDEVARERMNNRGTPHLVRFLETIPNYTESNRIAEAHRLELHHIDTDCPVGKLNGRALAFLREAKIINDGQQRDEVEVRS